MDRTHRTEAHKPRQVIEPTSAQTERVGQLSTRAVEFLRQGGDSFLATRADAVMNWGRKYSMFLYPFVTACCGMEFMSVPGRATTSTASAARCRVFRRARPTC